MLALPWVAATLVALVVRLPSLRDVMGLDVSVYATLGSEWLQGAVPYRDLFDHKGPLTYELYALFDLLLPSLPVALRLALIALFAVSAWQLAALVERHAGRRAAWCAAVAYAIGASSPALDGVDPNTEQLALPLLVACVDLADRGRPAAAAGAGAALAAAAMLKPTYALVGLVALVLLRRSPRALAAAAAGGLLTAAAVLAPLAVAGALDDAWDAVVTYNRENQGALFDALNGPREWFTYLVAWPGEALLVAGLVLGAAALRDPAHRRISLLAAGWLAAATVVAKLGGRPFGHYFVVAVPPLAVLAGAGLGALGGSRWVPAVVLSLLAATLALAPIRGAVALDPSDRFGFQHQPALAAVDEAATVVERETRRGETVYVLSGGAATPAGQAVYWLADRAPAARLLYPAAERGLPWEDARRDLERRPPSAVVVMPTAPEGEVDLAGLREVARFQTDVGPLRVLARR